MRLAAFGNIGRPGPEPGLRLLNVTGRPFVIVYRFDSDRFIIEAVFLTAQDR
jgi:plasmid stabilization system protein ParE